MKTFIRAAALFMLVVGIPRPSEAAKSCREPVIADPFGIWGCGSSFTKAGTSDVGGNKDDKLQPRSKRLWWWIHSDATIKIEFKNFNLYPSGGPYCPGTFTVNGNAYTTCDFTVVDKQETWTLVKFKADPASVDKTVKFDIVITDSSGSYTIDPQIEIDTDHNSFFAAAVAAAIGATLALVLIVVTVVLFRRFRRQSGG